MNRQIFKLEQLLRDGEQSIPFFFNYREENRPTPFGENGGESSVDWNKTPLQITIGPPMGNGMDAVSVIPEDLSDDDSLLSVLDNSNPENPDVLISSQTAEQAYQIILDRFVKLKAEWWSEVFGSEK